MCLTQARSSRSARKQADALWMTSKLYPDYYMNSFHYQTDGWLSPTSASVYEASTETLFLGRQDAMQVSLACISSLSFPPLSLSLSLSQFVFL